MTSFQNLISLHMY